MGVRVWEQGMGRCGLLGTVSVLQDEKHSKMDGVNTGNTSILSATESHFNPCKGLKWLYAACMCVRLSRFSHLQLFATPWTAARQAPWSAGVSRHG